MVTRTAQPKDPVPKGRGLRTGLSEQPYPSHRRCRFALVLIRVGSGELPNFRLPWAHVTKHVRRSGVDHAVDKDS